METILFDNRLWGYNYIGKFKEELAVVRKGIEEFHVKKNGEPAYEERYDKVHPFKNGFAVVRKNKEEFHIHPNGKLAYKNCYDSVMDFHEELAVAKKSDQYFHIRLDGKPAYKESFDRIVGDVKDVQAIAKKCGKWYTINAADGTIIKETDIVGNIEKSIKDRSSKNSKPKNFIFNSSYAF